MEIVFVDEVGEVLNLVLMDFSVIKPPRVRRTQPPDGSQ